MKKSLLVLFFIYMSILFGQTISPGTTLEKGEEIWSSNEQFYLAFQNDGNLVMYTSGGKAIWDAKTQNRGARAVFQHDGNFVVYDDNNNAIWYSNTQNKKAKSVRIQDDGNLCIYADNNANLWCSKSSQVINYSAVDNNTRLDNGDDFTKNEKIYSQNGNYYLTFQNDGNLVLYKSNGTALWSTLTHGKGDKAIFQYDGNLVVYDYDNNAVWNSKSQNKNGKRLVIQNDGNLVIYNSNNKAIWNTNTQGR